MNILHEFLLKIYESKSNVNSFDFCEKVISMIKNDINRLNDVYELQNYYEAMNYFESDNFKLTWQQLIAILKEWQTSEPDRRKLYDISSNFTQIRLFPKSLLSKKTPRKQKRKRITTAINQNTNKSNKTLRKTTEDENIVKSINNNNNNNRATTANIMMIANNNVNENSTKETESSLDFIRPPPPPPPSPPPPPPPAASSVIDSLLLNKEEDVEFNKSSLHLEENVVNLQENDERTQLNSSGNNNNKDKDNKVVDKPLEANDSIESIRKIRQDNNEKDPVAVESAPYFDLRSTENIEDYFKEDFYDNDNVEDNFKKNYCKLNETLQTQSNKNEEDEKKDSKHYIESNKTMIEAYNDDTI